MGYGKKIYDKAKTELESRRHSAEQKAEQNLGQFYLRCPQAQKIKSEIADNAAQAARAVLGGGDVHTAMKGLQDRAAELNAEYDRLLAENHLTRQDVTPQYTCEKCSDTGFVDGKLCSCFQQLQKSIAYEQLSMSIPLEKSSFEHFSLDYYKDDERAYRQMESIYRTCRDYADKLRPSSPSLLFRGGTGLGKTHLSLAIAGAAIEKGLGVIYDSTQSFAVALEKERFKRRDSDDFEDTNARLLSCDLLIMDDLGTEFPSDYTSAALYNVINARLLAGKPTIISTNLSMKQLEERYGDRFASRIAGYYGKLEFLGSDVRVEMRRRRPSGRKSEN